MRKVGAAARDIEAEDYDGVASMENKHDPFLALAVAGTATERIELHTSVAIAFARSSTVRRFSRSAGLPAGPLVAAALASRTLPSAYSAAGEPNCETDRAATPTPRPHRWR